jgi:hypothetical protein
MGVISLLVRNVRTAHITQEDVEVWLWKPYSIFQRTILWPRIDFPQLVHLTNLNIQRAIELMWNA